MRKSFVGFVAAVMFLIGFGVYAAPAQAATKGTYSNCMNGASKYGLVGVYWEYSGSQVRPYQVWFNQFTIGAKSMKVSYYTNNTLRTTKTFSQTGQTTQIHNVSGLPFGADSKSTYVTFSITVMNGMTCTGKVTAVV